MLSLDNLTLERLNAEAPSALVSQRRKALEEYRRLEMPSSKEENWKYVTLGFDLDQMGLPSAPGDPLPEDDFVAALSNRAGSAVMVDGRLMGVNNESEALLGPTMEFGENDLSPNLLTADTDKFAAASLAFSVDGITLRIPRNRAVEAPFVIDVQSTCPDTVIFPSLSIQAEENSEATVVVLFRSPDGVPSVIVPNLQTSVGYGARLSVTTVGLMGTEGANVMHHRSRIGRDATLRMGEIGLGGRLARMDLRTTLAGRGGSVEVVGLYYGEMQQVLDYRLVVNHVGPSTSSDVFLKGGVQDHAQSIFTGLLRIEEDAVGTSAFETNRNLVLSEGAKANSVPNLEILCNDVICGHGSSVGPLETEPLYYLMSRGISRARAERVLVRGFFEEAIKRLPLDDLNSPRPPSRQSAFRTGAGRRKSLMAWVEAADLADVREGQGVRVCHQGRVVAVFLTEGELYAVDDRCTHAEASLSEGEVFDTEVECPLHGAVFDLVTGEALTLPATRPVVTYPTRVDGGRVLVQVPDDGPGAI